jgi:hypothetical protein
METPNLIYTDPSRMHADVPTRNITKDDYDADGKIGGWTAEQLIASGMYKADNTEATTPDFNPQPTTMRDFLAQKVGTQTDRAYMAMGQTTAPLGDPVTIEPTAPVEPPTEPATPPIVEQPPPFVWEQPAPPIVPEAQAAPATDHVEEAALWQLAIRFSGLPKPRLKLRPARRWQQLPSCSVS